MNRRSIIFVLLFAAVGRAGVIVTTDGTRYEGDITRDGGGWRVTPLAGKSVVVPVSSVRSIELSGSTSVSTASEGLQSLRRSVEASDDLPRIIERYKKFIDQTADASTSAAAKEDLQLWQDRLSQHLVKAGKEWVSLEEKAARDAAGSQAAQEARLLIKAGKLKEAAALLDAAQQQNGGNISVLYLQGVLADAHGDPQSAKKDFTAVQQAAADHAPTLLNLAVLAMRQKQWAAAATWLDQALAAAPNVQPLVDAAELLAAMPDEQHRSPPALKLAKIFADQDQQLQKTMAGKKKFRWGSTWVDQPTMDKITAADAASKKKVADLQGDFNLTQGRIQRIDSETADNNRAMRDMEAHSWVPMADGTYVRAPLPPAYYDLQKQITQLHGERVEMSNRLNALRDAAKQAREDVPVPKYIGKIAMIGEDGMPVIAPAAVPAVPLQQAPMPTTMPAATQPAATPPYIKIVPATRPIDVPRTFAAKII